MIKIMVALLAAVGFMGVEALRFLNDIKDTISGIDWDSANLAIEHIKDQYIVLDVNHDYMVYEELNNGSYQYIDTFDTKAEVVRYINDMKVTFKSQ